MSEEIFKIEPVRNTEYCHVIVYYNGRIVLKNLTLWMHNYKILVGNLEKNAVKNVTIDCNYMEEPSKISFTIGGIYPVELEFKKTGGSV